MATSRTLGRSAQNAVACFARLRPVFFKMTLADILKELNQQDGADFFALVDCVCVMVQSTECLELLLSSQFLDASCGRIENTLLAPSISHSDYNVVIRLLTCLSELCRKCGIQGSLEGNRQRFWQPLLLHLCITSPRTRTLSVAHARHWTALQNASLSFFSAVIRNHPGNSKTLVQLLCDMLKHKGVQPAMGFTRQLLAALLLQSESIRIVLRQRSPQAQPGGKLYHSDCQQQVGNHLRWPVGRGILVREMSVCCSMLQLSETMLPPKPGTAANAAPAGAVAAANAAAAAAAATAAATAVAAGAAVPSVPAPGAGSIPLAGFAGLANVAGSGDSQAASNTWKQLLKKYQMDGEFSFMDESELQELETKYSSVVKGERDTSSEEILPASLLAGVNFHPSPSEPALDSSCTLADVLEHSPRGGGSCCDLQLFYSLPGSATDKAKSHDVSSSVTSLAAKIRAARVDDSCTGAFALLKEFALQNGLITLAEHLPCWYGGIQQLVATEALTAVAKRDHEEFPSVRPLPGYVPVLPPFDESVWPSSATRLPSHTMSALALLLRLPGYAEGFARCKPQAATLLRLLLGVPYESKSI